MNEAGKITVSHRCRSAVIYVRQSTLAQVERNTESTARQYDLVARARELGWPRERDPRDRRRPGPLRRRYSGSGTGSRRWSPRSRWARSGSSWRWRCSRLARDNADWYRLLDLAGACDTLIGDDDGVYHPALFNDRLLLGLKGIMSEALCRNRHNASYADSAVMPIMLCECAADLAGSPGESA